MKQSHMHTSCPSKEEFQRVLSQKAGFDESLRFYQHIEACPFCRDAYEGYQAVPGAEMRTAAKRPQKQVLRNYAYAATIALLVGAYFFFQFMDGQKVHFDSALSAQAALYNYQNSDANDKNLHKSSDSYWLINEFGQIFLNDQAVQEKDIDQIKLPEGAVAYLSVKDKDAAIPNRLIQKLKEEKQQKVLVY